MAWTKEAREKAIASKKKTGNLNQYSKAKNNGGEIPINPNKGKSGHFKGKKHSESTKKIIKEKALASGHRRLKKSTIEYNGILLDSQWEFELAKQLDFNDIKWIRPEPLKWIDKDGLVHNYFPDFYLPEYDIFVDPKNPYAYKVQKDKIDILKKQFTNIIFLCNIKEIKEFASVVKQDITRVF